MVDIETSDRPVRAVSTALVEAVSAMMAPRRATQADLLEVLGLDLLAETNCHAESAAA